MYYLLNKIFIKTILSKNFQLKLLNLPNFIYSVYLSVIKLQIIKKIQQDFKVQDFNTSFLNPYINLILNYFKYNNILIIFSNKF